ncbi:MAG: BMP family ABC transporter substrate-binding protein, partial [Micrococcales bacterium]|nr:BMP family ABC transporter substrate-binding protein [Micrococcales bacterium]
EFFRYFVHSDAEWPASRFNLASDYPLARAKLSKELDIESADLKAFFSRGGKLLMYHGWQDAAIPPENTIGFVGGMKIPAVQRFYSGFAAGIESVNPDATVTAAYVGSFADSAKAKELALGFYDQGADIVMDVAGGGGIGVFDAAKQLGDGHWVVSTDTCKVDLAPDNFLTSAVKDVAGAVLRENTAAAEGTFEGGTVTLGLADGGVGLCQENIDTLSSDILTVVDTATTAISDGTLVPPATPEELAEFTAPAL